MQRPHLPAPDDVPPQLRDLAARAETLPAALRDALQACLMEALPDASPEQVVTDACARLGYLPDEAKLTSNKLLSSIQ